jgi:hypothetical protein
MKRTGLPRPFVALCVLIGVLVGAYAVLTLLSIATASTEHRTRVFRAVDQLRIDAGPGDVTIVGERRDDVRVELAIQRGMWRGAWQPQVDVRPGGRFLKLESHCSLWAHIGVSDCGASFTVRVPRGTRVSVAGSSGSVWVARLAGPVAVESRSGDVHADDASGPLTLDASSGDIAVEGYRGTRLSIHAGSGDVEIRALRVPRRLRAEASSGDVDVVVPDVPYRVAVDTGSGDEDVQVRHDPSSPRRIDASTSSGDVSILATGAGR